MLRLVRHQRPRRYHAPPSPPKPPKPPKKPLSFTLHDATWQDDYNWMSHLKDRVAMRHMNLHMDAEGTYGHALLEPTENLQAKLFSEMTTRYHHALATPPLRFGPWLYYRRLDHHKPYPLLCRRLFSLHHKFLSNTDPALGFDFVTGIKIEQKLIDYNAEADRFGGYAYEELSQVSPDHKYIAYTMFDKDNDCFRLSVRNLNTGALCSKPQAYRVCGLAWAKNGTALVYAVTDQHKRPCRVFCSVIGSVDEDVLMVDEVDEGVQISIRNTKDFRYITVNSCTRDSSKVFVINADDPCSGMRLLFSCDSLCHCVVEHHNGVFYLFTDAPRDDRILDHHYIMFKRSGDLDGEWRDLFKELTLDDVDFCEKFMVLSIREGRVPKLCSVALPLPLHKAPLMLDEVNPKFLALPQNVSKIGPGTNYDFKSSVMRYTISSPVMPDAVVDYDLANDKWNIVLQKEVIHVRTKVLYGTSTREIVRDPNFPERQSENKNPWNEVAEYYACEDHEVVSPDGVKVPLTIVYAKKSKTESGKPGLLHGHGAYGEPLDKRWRTEHKSLLDRGWIIAFADVRGGGGMGKRWIREGRKGKKMNSVRDFIACGRYLVENGIVEEEKLCASGYSAGALLVAAAMNSCPDLFRASILNVPFLDAVNTLVNPVIPMAASDYEEYGYPGNKEDFEGIMGISPYENVPFDVSYPAVMVTSSYDSRFGIWEAAKYVTRVRERTISDPKRPVIINWTRDSADHSKYLECRNSAMEAAFLMHMVET